MAVVLLKLVVLVVLVVVLVLLEVVVLVEVEINKLARALQHLQVHKETLVVVDLTGGPDPNRYSGGGGGAGGAGNPGDNGANGGNGGWY